MWVYQHSKEHSLWTVGFFTPNGTWEAIRDCQTEAQAVKWVNYLNGGSGDGPPYTV